MTPINIDPEKPAMPIGYPAVYPVYLAKRQGPYATLGLAEDTWGLNEHVLDDEHFLQQCLDTDREREAMFFDALDKVREGSVRLRLRRHRPHAAHVLALPRRDASGPAQQKSPPNTPTRSRTSTGAWTTWSAGRWRNAGPTTRC